MPMKVKNWERFQHYRGRRPPWIKLYRDLLDDHEWHTLDPAPAKMLVSLWLIASESGDGELPGVEVLAFRLRLTVERVTRLLAMLNHWLVQDASKTLAPCKQDAMPETETETETETDSPSPAAPVAFDRFWGSYPKKVGKQEARKVWERCKLDSKLDPILAALEWQTKSQGWRDEGGRFIPNPATWLRQGRWEDEPIKAIRAPAPQGDQDRRNAHASAVREIVAAGRTAREAASTPGDWERWRAAAWDKYRDNKPALREALDILAGDGLSLVEPAPVAAKEAT